MEYQIETIQNILKQYDMFSKLKVLNRSGWQQWHLGNVRAESVAEHVYGAMMLAVSIFNNITLDLDIKKVLIMLALHETEEIYIGDITPFDRENMQYECESGEQAVLKVFSNGKNKQPFLDIINEFNEQQTKEAKFAYQIDKLEANIQATKYDNKFQLSKVDPLLKNHPKILQFKKNGLNKVSEFFIENNIKEYDGITLSIANYLKQILRKNNNKK